MHSIDWLIIGIYLVFSIGIALFFTRRSGKDTESFFLSGRSLPWWLAGTSMVATTFAADTPLAVTELVAKNGIAGNWLWWNMAFGGLLSVFFFARLWRRSGLLTDVQFVELRYSGKPAAVLRGVKAVYFGLFLNSIIIAWVCLAMMTVIEVLFPDATFFGLTAISLAGFNCSAAFLWTFCLVLAVAVYSLLGGLWGVTITDFIQFGIAMTGSVLLAVFAVKAPGIGSMSALKAKLPEWMFSFLPTISNDAATNASGAGHALALTVSAFLAYITIQWWASWYPGAEPGGGGYIAQRMMSAKNEKHSVLAALWFNIAHYCLRPWPWIIAALASVVLYPDLTNARAGYVMLIREHLPVGVRGLLVASFLAAFMSTISTQLNWGASYLVNDLWRRFFDTSGNERRLVTVSRVTTFLLAVFSMGVMYNLDTIKHAWELIITASAGLGLVLILRWYWWRVNVWSELVATCVPLLLIVLSLFGVPVLNSPFPDNLYIICGITTASWLLVTFITPAESKATLHAFYRQVHPGGPGWSKIAAACGMSSSDSNLGAQAAGWIGSVVLLYTVLFGTGFVLFQEWSKLLVVLPIAIIALAITLYGLKKMSRDS